MHTVLVLGSHGMLGSALVKRFSGIFDVAAWDKKDVDITNESEVEKKITALHPDVIINATGHNGVDLTETDDAAYKMAVKLNGEAVGYLASLANKLAIPLVHFSTDYVFDGGTTEGYDEDARPHPLSKYGKTKLMGEQFLQKNTDQFYLVRISRLFGPPGPSEASKKSFVDLMLDLAHQGKESVVLVDAEISCPTFSNDAADFTFRLLSDQVPFGVYHGANSGGCTWHELGKKVFELRGLPMRVKKVDAHTFPRAARRPEYSVLRNTKRPPQRAWQDALAEYLQNG